jgi:hypothetical protein
LSIGSRNLKKYIHLFDAIEYSWVYSTKYNHNLKAEAIAHECHKPMISTADVHMLRKLDMDHALIVVEDFTAKAVFDAIRHEHFENITAPKRFLSIAKYLATIIGRHIYKIIKHEILALNPNKLEPVSEAVE